MFLLSFMLHGLKNCELNPPGEVSPTIPTPLNSYFT